MLLSHANTIFFFPGFRPSWELCNSQLKCGVWTDAVWPSMVLFTLPGISTTKYLWHREDSFLFGLPRRPSLLFGFCVIMELLNPLFAERRKRQHTWMKCKKRERAMFFVHCTVLASTSTIYLVQWHFLLGLMHIHVCQHGTCTALETCKRWNLRQSAICGVAYMYKNTRLMYGWKWNQPSAG